MTWLTVHTRPRREDEACENLQRQGFTVFLPRLHLRQRRRGRLQWKTVPLFPRYLFVDVTPGEHNLSVIRSTRGAVDLVRFGNALVPVPDEVVAYLQSAQDPAINAAIEPELNYKAGERVEILEGPFTGLTAVFQMLRDEDRALLLIDLLGRRTEVAIPIEDFCSLN